MTTDSVSFLRKRNIHPCAESLMTKRIITT